MSEVNVLFAPSRRTRSDAHSAVPRFYPARIARCLALAHSLQARVVSGEFHDLADLARALGFTRARVTQLMDLLLLAPDIQEEILFMEVPPGRQLIAERRLRYVVATVDWGQQHERWRRLKLHSRTE